MPALPEIEILRGDLEREVVGRKIKEVEVCQNRHAFKVVSSHARRKDVADLLAGVKVTAVGRIGKLLTLELDNDHVIVVELGPSGGLSKGAASQDRASGTHLIVSFTIGGQLRFTDPAAGSEVAILTREEAERMVDQRKAAIDPLSQHLAWHHFSALLGERAQPMLSLVRDNSFICGLHPIYTDEILFEAALRHDRASDRLTSQDVRRLYRALMETLQEAVKQRGTTTEDHPFHDLMGAPGSYQQSLQVYGREGEMCKRCRHSIAAHEIDEVVTYFCPQCQS